MILRNLHKKKITRIGEFSNISAYKVTFKFRYFRLAKILLILKSMFMWDINSLFYFNIFVSLGYQSNAGSCNIESLLKYLL